MSKHKSTEEKLQVTPSPKQRLGKLKNSQQQLSPAPPAGTNANNQYR